MAGQYGFYVSHLTEVKPKINKPVERMLMAFTKSENDSIVEEELIIQHDARNDYTDDYIALTKEFYLKM